MVIPTRVSFAATSLAIAVGLCIAVPARASAIINGDFETGDLSGWVATGNLYVAPTPYYGVTDPAYGTRVAAFNGGNGPTDGILSQSITTEIGANYVLAFNYAVTTNGNQSITAFIDDDMGNNLTSTVASSTTSTLAQFTLGFTAVSANTTIKFEDLASNDTTNQDGVIDNVSVTAVPEPGSMALLGFVATGLVATRRLSRSSVLQQD